MSQKVASLAKRPLSVVLVSPFTDWLQLLRLNGQEVKEQVPGTHTRKNLKFWLCVCLKTCTLTRRHAHKQQHTQKTHTQKSSPIPCARVLLVISNYLCLLCFFSQPKNTTKGSEIIKKKKKKMLFLLRAPNLAKRGEKKKETKLKALFHKTTATTTHKKQILLSKRKSERCVQGGAGWGWGEHANNNNVIDTMKTNESL